MVALPQTGLQQAPVRDAHDKAAIARARLKACPADVAAAWAEDYPPPQSSFNDVEAAENDPPRRSKKKTCPRCFEGPGAYAAICIECPSPPPKRRRKEAVALAP